MAAKYFVTKFIPEKFKKKYDEDYGKGKWYFYTGELDSLVDPLKPEGTTMPSPLGCLEVNKKGVGKDLDATEYDKLVGSLSKESLNKGQKYDVFSIKPGYTGRVTIGNGDSGFFGKNGSDQYYEVFYRKKDYRTEDEKLAEQQAKKEKQIQAQKAKEEKDEENKKMERYKEFEKKLNEIYDCNDKGNEQTAIGDLCKEYEDALKYKYDKSGKLDFNSIKGKAIKGVEEARNLAQEQKKSAEKAEVLRMSKDFWNKSIDIRNAATYYTSEQFFNKLNKMNLLKTVLYLKSELEKGNKDVPEKVASSIEEIKRILSEKNATWPSAKNLKNLENQDADEDNSNKMSMKDKIKMLGGLDPNKMGKGISGKGLNELKNKKDKTSETSQIPEISDEKLEKPTGNVNASIENNKVYIKYVKADKVSGLTGAPKNAKRVWAAIGANGVYGIVSSDFLKTEAITAENISGKKIYYVSSDKPLELTLIESGYEDKEKRPIYEIKSKKEVNIIRYSNNEGFPTGGMVKTAFQQGYIKYNEYVIVDDKKGLRGPILNADGKIVRPTDAKGIDSTNTAKYHYIDGGGTKHFFTVDENSTVHLSSGEPPKADDTVAPAVPDAAAIPAAPPPAPGTIPAAPPAPGTIPAAPPAPGTIPAAPPAPAKMGEKAPVVPEKPIEDKANDDQKPQVQAQELVEKQADIKPVADVPVEPQADDVSEDEMEGAKREESLRISTALNNEFGPGNVYAPKDSKEIVTIIKRINKLIGKKVVSGSERGLRVIWSAIMSSDENHYCRTEKGSAVREMGQNRIERYRNFDSKSNYSKDDGESEKKLAKKYKKLANEEWRAIKDLFKNELDRMEREKNSTSLRSKAHNLKKSLETGFRNTIGKHIQILSVKKSTVRTCFKNAAGYLNGLGGDKSFDAKDLYACFVPIGNEDSTWYKNLGKVLASNTNLGKCIANGEGDEAKKINVATAAIFVSMMALKNEKLILDACISFRDKISNKDTKDICNIISKADLKDFGAKGKQDDSTALGKVIKKQCIDKLKLTDSEYKNIRRLMKLSSKKAIAANEMQAHDDKHQ